MQFYISTIINKYRNYTTIIIKDSTDCYGNKNIVEYYKFEYLKVYFKDLQKETLDSFIKLNQQSSKVKLEIKHNKKIVYITNSEVPKPHINIEAWEEFYEKYGKYGETQGIMTFSNIGFNKLKTQALFYYGNSSGLTAGGGYLILFEKINNEWKISFEMDIWMS